MLAAAAAVRAAAFASRGARPGLPPPNHMGPNSYPFGPYGFPGNSTEQMPSPFGPNSNVQSPEFGVMSPNKDLAINSMGGMMNQGRQTSRSIPPPPYSPIPQSNESNHSASGSVKGSISNLATTQQIKTEDSAEGRFFFSFFWWSSKYFFYKPKL